MRWWHMKIFGVVIHDAFEAFPFFGPSSKAVASYPRSRVLLSAVSLFYV